MIKKFLETGKIVGTHGVRGMVRVQPWCDSAEFLTGFKYLYTDDEGRNKLKIVNAKPHGNVILMTIDGVGSIEDAERLRGKVIYIDRKDVKLPEGRYFISDILNCAVTDADSGEILGILSDVTETGANDVWHIKRGDKEYLVPAIADVIVSVKPEENFVSIRPLKGIFDNED
ncbi:MAG: 16S rRNA processing protein RimM [Clostridia bacterium]|nr:16S rRNA processing protein RimM [Clostridia bacterium]